MHRETGRATEIALMTPLGVAFCALETHLLSYFLEV